MDGKSTPDNEMRLTQAKELDKFLSENANVIQGAGYTQAAKRILFRGDVEKYSEISEDELKTRIASCREAYENMGIIGNCIDLMVDFALEDFSIIHPSPVIQNFYTNWALKVDLLGVSEQILKCLFRDSNVPVYQYRRTVSPTEVSRLKQAFAKKGAKEFFGDPEPETRVIPRIYRVLDVLKLSKVGSETFGQVQYSYRMPTSEQRRILQGGEKAKRDMVAFIGKENWSRFEHNGEIPLNPDRLSMLYYKKDSYRSWANPMLWRIIDDVRFKTLLRQMDISVAESVCNTLTIIRLGKAEEGLMPSPAKYNKLVDLMQTPTKSKLLIWDNLIDIKAEYPPVDKILGAEKYEQVDNDIRSGLGIPEILVNGGGGNYSTSYLSVKTLLERLETGRTILLTWINQQLALVAKAMKFRKPAWVRMRYMSLNDDELQKKLLLELADRNVISYRTLAELFGHNFEIEVHRMREEDKMREGDDSLFALQKTGKFGPPLEASLVGDDESKETEITDIDLPTSQEQEGDKGGRPPGTRKKQEVRRNRKPQGEGLASIMATLIDPDTFCETRRKVDRVFSLLDGVIAKVEKSKPSEEQQIEEWSACAIKALMADISEDISAKELSEVLSADLTTAPAKLDRCVDRVRKQKIKEFRKKKGRSPNKEEMKDIVSSAWAICRDALDM